MITKHFFKILFITLILVTAVGIKSLLLSLFPINTNLIPPEVKDAMFTFQQVLSIPKKSKTTILFTGDIMLGRSVNQGILSRNDPSWPFRGIHELTRSADIVFGNLESPLIYSCPVINTGYKFCGNSKNVQGLVDSGFKVIGIANNHIANFGESGIEETIRILTDAGIKPVGTTKDPVVISHNGHNFAFFAANDVGPTPRSINTLNADFFKKIKESKSRGEIVVVGVHWGSEYTHEPSQDVKGKTKALLDSGASYIVGNHAHWTQPVEQLENGVVMYSLGNTIFDQEWSKETKEGILVKVVINNSSLESVNTIPVFIKNYGEASLIKD